MAVLLDNHPIGTWVSVGTLARAPLAGGAPREVVDRVQWADWGPDGNNVAIVRDVGGRNRLEYPPGKMLYETGGWIGHVRLSPKGDLIAFLDHPIQGDDSGSVAVVDLSGKKKTLSDGWYSSQGLAWSPDGEEIWFTGNKSGIDRALYAVSLAGKERLVARMPGTLMLLDIWKDGRLLLNRASWRRELTAVADGKERDLTWLDYSYPADISADGKTLLFDEEGGGGSLAYGKSGGLSYAVYLRKTDGSPAVLLGEGAAIALSPDEKWVIAQTQQSPAQLNLLPTKAGTAKPLTHDAINHAWARWFPDGKRAVFRERTGSRRAALCPGCGRRDAESDHARGDARERVPGLSRWAVGCGYRSGPTGLHLSHCGRRWPSDSWYGNGRTTHRMVARWAFTLHIPPWGASSQGLAAGVGHRTESCAGTTDAG